VGLPFGNCPWGLGDTETTCVRDQERVRPFVTPAATVNANPITQKVAKSRHHNHTSLYQPKSEAQRQLPLNRQRANAMATAAAGLVKMSQRRLPPVEAESIRVE